MSKNATAKISTKFHSAKLLERILSLLTQVEHAVSVGSKAVAAQLRGGRRGIAGTRRVGR